MRLPHVQTRKAKSFASKAPTEPAPEQFVTALEPPSVGSVAAVSDVSPTPPVCEPEPALASTSTAIPETEAVTVAESATNEVAPLAAPSVASESSPEPVKALATQAEAVVEKLSQKETATQPSDESFVTRAAARRQRALERQRRQPPTTVPTTNSAWWTTHVPVIAVGFIVALLVTIYFARSHKHTTDRAPEVAGDVPTLEIDTGDVATATPGPRELTVASDATPSKLVEPPAAKKSPPLLTAKPIGPAVDSQTRHEVATENGDEFQSERSAAAATVALAQKAAEAADTGDEYPATDPSAYRPGGRPPRTARAPREPEYPQTSTPHLR
jgi:hypothetical protein